jgi:hypothetical protein
VLTVPKSNARDDRESTAVDVDLAAYGFVTTLDSRHHFVFRDAGVELTLVSRKGGQLPVDPKNTAGNISPQSLWTTELTKLYCRRLSDDCRNIPHAYLAGNSVIDPENRPQPHKCDWTVHH